MIDIGQTKDGRIVGLPLARANRHGFITGSTGSGKTTTMQMMIEQFSSAGVPTFAADIKGDLSGVGAMGDDASVLAEKTRALGKEFRADKCPTALWDLWGTHGLRIRASIQEMGSELLGRMLRLNDTQQGALDIAFRKSDDDKSWMLTLDDLRWTLADMLEAREDVSRQYGNITASSINTILRQLLALEVQGGDQLFGEPPFDIMDFMRTDGNGRGVVNLLHADRLLECPRLYSTFLLWLLTELFRKLPEAGDVDKPKLVFFFDEAHLLFTDAPKELIQQVERLVRLVRSKGVGVFFVTQSPADVPDTVLAQLGSRIQHALRAYTPKDQRMVRAAAQAFRENREVDVKAEITKLGVGEALISVLDAEGIPTKVEKVSIIPPSAQVGPISSIERRAIIEGVDGASTPLFRKYGAMPAEQDAVHTFMNRMRRQRGLAEAESSGGWQEGDYKKFLPDFSAMMPEGDPQRPGRGYYLRGLILWGSVVAASVIGLRAMI